MYAWQARTSHVARRVGSISGTAGRLRFAFAAKVMAAKVMGAAPHLVKSAPDAEATAAELAARERADSAMHALLAEVGSYSFTLRITHIMLSQAVKSQLVVYIMHDRIAHAN